MELRGQFANNRNKVEITNANMQDSRTVNTVASFLSKHILIMKMTSRKQFENSPGKRRKHVSSLVLFSFCLLKELSKILVPYKISII